MDNIFLKLRQLPKAKGALGLLGVLGTVALAGASISPLFAQVDFGSFANKARQAEAKTNMSNMREAEKAYYAGKGKFTASIAQLGIQPDTQNYHYRVALPKGKGIPRVMMTAQAKRFDTRSYTSAVFVFSSNNKPVFVAGTCETNPPSTKPPVMPTAPKNASGQIRCPSGSHLI